MGISPYLIAACLLVVKLMTTELLVWVLIERSVSTFYPLSHIHSFRSGTLTYSNPIRANFRALVLVAGLAVPFASGICPVTMRIKLTQVQKRRNRKKLGH